MKKMSLKGMKRATRKGNLEVVKWLYEKEDVQQMR